LGSGLIWISLRPLRGFSAISAVKSLALDV
jgi:hypothetical protein